MVQLRPFNLSAFTVSPPHLLLTPLMESSLLISATTSASDRYGTPQVERTPELSGSRNASGNDIGATVQCERRHCKRLVPRTTVRKVTAQEPNGIKKPMLVCPGCYRHYKDKASTIRERHLFLSFRCETNAPCSHRNHSISLECQLGRN